MTRTEKGIAAAMVLLALIIGLLVTGICFTVHEAAEIDVREVVVGVGKEVRSVYKDITEDD